MVEAIDERVTELLLAGLDEWLLSNCAVESLEGLVVEVDLVADLFLGVAMLG